MTESTYQLQIALKGFEYYFIEKAHREINEMVSLFNKKKNEEDQRSRRLKGLSETGGPANDFLDQNGKTIQNIQFNHVQFNKCTLPLKIVRYTVIRSPHIDKKARDQFEIRQHKRVLKHKGHWSAQDVRIFLENLKHRSFNGVQIQLKIASSSCGPTKNKNLVS